MFFDGRFLSASGTHSCYQLFIYHGKYFAQVIEVDFDFNLNWSATMEEIHPKISKVETPTE